MTRHPDGASSGANATSRPGVTVGRRAMIGAGAVVTADVPANAKVVGNPGSIIGYVDTDVVEDDVAPGHHEPEPIATRRTGDADLDGDDKLAFLADLGQTEPGLDRVIHAGYKLLGLQTYFTARPTEVLAWTVAVCATATQAAGGIHTDFEKGCIRPRPNAVYDIIRRTG